MERTDVVVASGKKAPGTKLPKLALKGRNYLTNPGPSCLPHQDGSPVGAGTVNHSDKADVVVHNSTLTTRISCSHSTTSTTASCSHITTSTTASCSHITTSTTASCSHSTTSTTASYSHSTTSNIASCGDVLKLTATSPKRVSRDGGGGPSNSKGRLRLDTEGKPKAKIFFREKVTTDQVPKNVDQAVTREHFQRASSHDNAIYFRRAEEIRDPSLPSHSMRSNRSSTTSAFVPSAGSIKTDGPEGPSYRSQSSVGAEQPSYQTDLKRLSSGLIHQQEIVKVSRHRQDLTHKPLHGILKDSSNNGHTTSTSLHPIRNANRYQYSDPSGHPRDNAYIQNPQHPSRSPSVGGRADQIYQQVCASLPGSSRSATPDNYSYGSCLVRANPDPVTQKDALYKDNPGNWGSVPRKTESDSGFSVGSIDHSDNNYAVINYKRGNQRITEYSNQTYGTVGHNYQLSRPESVPATRRESPDSLYSVIRPGSVPPQHYSDTEGGRCYRGPRAGSVPVGHEPASVAQGRVGPHQSRRGTDPGNYETASDYASGSSSSLRTDTGSRQYRNGRGKRLVPRRHTVATPAKKGIKDQETEKKREAFMELLAQRYPQYADKIQGAESPTPSQMLQQDKPTRVRDVQRRRTAVVSYNPNQASNVLEYEDMGTMSDLELPSFQRGGFMRTSLPIVRSASTSLERPLGLVFLVYGDQTKKSMLPNEITTLDTVRALFVRAFPDLTLEMLENPRKKIYLLDPATNIYFQLEDLMDIKDRSVLKIHETDSDQPQKVREKQEVRGRTVQVPASRPQQAYGELPIGHEVFTKSQSLPPQVAHNYSEVMQEQRNLWEFERRSRSRTPELAERPRSLSAGASSRQRFSHSPDRLPTPERVPLNPIPENRQLLEGYREQGNFYETVGPGTYRGQYPAGIYESPVPYQGYPPASQIPPQQTYIARSTRAPSIALPQRAIAPGHDPRDSPRSSNANRHSLAFAAMSGPQAAAAEGEFQNSQNYRIPPAEREGPDLPRTVTPGDDMTRNRIEKMEQQLANLTRWVHCQKDGTRRESVPRSLGSMTSEGSDTLPASSTSKHKGETPSLSTISTLTDNVQSQGLSDFHDGSSNQRSSGLSSRESTPLSAHLEISIQLAQLRSDLHVLRRQQQLNMEAMRDEFMAAAANIKKVLSSMPGAENQVNFYKRNEAAIAKRNYIDDKEQVEKELGDLEASVEELRTDVISRQCRVNTCDVEGMALLLSNITKSLADLKAQFPEVQSLMKNVMDAELRVVVAEEKFLKEEPTEIEYSLKRCKKITGTLYTLKRLASVQDHRPPHVPNMAPDTESSLQDQKKALLDNIKALVPDHEQRVKEMEAADASRERKKKISSQQEALKFGKSLEKASKNLRPPSLTDVRGQAGNENLDADNEYRSDTGYQSDQGKPAIPVKLITSAATTHLSSTTTTSSKLPTSISSSSVKTLPLASATVKPLDKPTATVSAMTAGVSDTITMMATKASERDSGPSMIKNMSIPLTQTTDSLTSTALGKAETITHSVRVGTESPKKKDATVYAYQVSGPINTVFPVSTPVFKHKNNDASSTKTTDFRDKLVDVNSDKFKQELSTRDMHLPQDLPLTKVDSMKQGLVSISDQSLAATNKGCTSPLNTDNEQLDSKEKVDLAIQKQTARSAFFSSLHTPPDSPSMSSSHNRNSAGLEPGPVISPTGHGVNVTEDATTNMIMSGMASPKSSTSSRTSTTSLASEVRPPMSTQNQTAPSPLTSPSHGIPHSAANNRLSSHDSHSSTGSDFSSKQKKVPPPPPPRKDSRPTSANISPVNGDPLDLSMQQSRDMPRFVGGILGQHRLSGGPLFSTPKPMVQQKPVSRFEQDIASGIYANMNRPDVQSQKRSAQQMISEANIPSHASTINAPTQSHNSAEGIPPPPSVTIALDREERGSSSESSSSSSSSGTSMGSQQSVVSVIRSPSAADKGSSKPKPDPPKRQSSLLAKLTGNKESKSKVNNGKAKANGVDL